MVKGTDVLSDSSEYQKVLGDCKNKFSDLGSNWEGTSYTQLNNKVGSFIAEAGLVTTQMSSLANACSKYEKYVPLARETKQLRIDLAAEKDKVAAPDGSGGPDATKIALLEQKISGNVAQMKQLNSSAISSLGEIHGEIQYTALTNTDFVSGVSTLV